MVSSMESSSSSEADSPRFCNMLFFCGGKLLVPRPNAKLRTTIYRERRWLATHYTNPYICS